MIFIIIKEILQYIHHNTNENIKLKGNAYVLQKFHFFFFFFFLNFIYYNLPFFFFFLLINCVPTLVSCILLYSFHSSLDILCVFDTPNLSIHKS